MNAHVPIALLFQWLKTMFAASYPAADSLIYSGIVLGAVTLAIAIYALSGLSETFGKDLDYVET